MKKSKDKIKNDVEYNKFLQEVGEQFRQIHEMARQHGLFLGDREIVSCTQCGLTEDVAFDGKLFTYYSGDSEFKETGLQFIELENNSEYLRCPICNVDVLIPQEKE